MPLLTCLTRCTRAIPAYSPAFTIRTYASASSSSSSKKPQSKPLGLKKKGKKGKGAAAGVRDNRMITMRGILYPIKKLRREDGPHAAPKAERGELMQKFFFGLEVHETIVRAMELKRLRDFQQRESETQRKMDEMKFAFDKLLLEDPEMYAKVTKRKTPQDSEDPIRLDGLFPITLRPPVLFRQTGWNYDWKDPRKAAEAAAKVDADAKIEESKVLQES